MSNIMLYAEVTGDNYLHTVVFELANKAHELAKKLDNGTVSALLVCKSGLAENFKEAFSNSGFDYVCLVENNRFTHYSTELYSKIAIDISKDVKPEIILIGATTQGRDLAPRIAATLHTGLTADCIDLDINEKGKLAATRPTFGGKLMATILCKTLPQMATVRPKVFKPMSEDCVRPTQYVYVKPEIDFIKARADFYPVLFENHSAGKLPLRVSHNDTKCNNVLLDNTTRKALCVIDLDTIMPGFSVTDFGDAIRFGASTAAEDEKDLSKVELDMEKFRVYTKGFLDGCGGLLSDSEIMLLPEGAKMMTPPLLTEELKAYLKQAGLGACISIFTGVR